MFCREVKVPLLHFCSTRADGIEGLFLVSVRACSLYCSSQVVPLNCSEGTSEISSTTEKTKQPHRTCGSFFIKCDRHDLKDVSWGGHGELVSVCPSGHLRPPLLFPSFRPFCFSLAGGHWTGQNWNLCLLEISSSSSGLLVTLCVQDAAVASLHQSAFRIALPCGVEFFS